MIYTIPSAELYLTIARAYVNRGLSPEQARAKLIGMKNIMPIKGTLYKVRYNRVMALMYQIINQQGAANK